MNLLFTVRLHFLPSGRNQASLVSKAAHRYSLDCKLAGARRQGISRSVREGHGWNTRGVQPCGYSQLSSCALKPPIFTRLAVAAPHRQLSKASDEAVEGVGLVCTQRHQQQVGMGTSASAKLRHEPVGILRF